MIKQPTRFGARRAGARTLRPAQVALVLELEYRRARRDLRRVDDGVAQA